MSNGYLGPAGIFSTGNPVSDAMQIEAEQGPPDEQEDGFFEDYAVEDVVYGYCDQCDWIDHDIYWQGDAKGQEAAQHRLEERHHRERPDCPGNLQFG